MYHKLILPFFFLVVFAFASPLAAKSDDERAVKAVYQAYATTWLHNDETVPAGIMGLFTEDAVIMPHHGDPVRKGKEAIAEFWFPGGIASGTVDAYAHQVVGHEVIGDMAYIYGRFSLKFTYGESVTENEGNQLAVLKRTQDGWKIAAIIWNDPVPQVIAAP